MASSRTFLILLAATALAGCDLRYALFGFPQPVAKIAGAFPVELSYREARGGLVILTGRVNGRAEVDFILDTGAPVTVLIDGPRTAALGLDSSRARRLGGDSPAAPMGDIQEDFALAFGPVALTGMAVVVVPESSMPCREKFAEIGFGGVIGADLFRRFVVEVDPSARRVRLHEPSAWRVPPSATVAPIAFHAGHPFVEATLRTGDAEIPLRMNVDTGMNRALTLAVGSHPAIVMPSNGVVRKSCYVSGVREEREADGLVEVGLGGARIPVPKAVYSQSPNAVDGERTSTLGAGLFMGRRHFIDYPGRRLVLVP